MRRRWPLRAARLAATTPAPRPGRSVPSSSTSNCTGPRLEATTSSAIYLCLSVPARVAYAPGPLHIVDTEGKSYERPVRALLSLPTGLGTAASVEERA